jgi:hypothetical protein
MKNKTGLYLGGALLVIVLVYVLTRPAAKAGTSATTTGASASTTNTILGTVTALANLGSKLVPKSGSNSSRPDTIGTGVYNGPGVDYGNSDPSSFGTGGTADTLDYSF